MWITDLLKLLTQLYRVQRVLDDSSLGAGGVAGAGWHTGSSLPSPPERHCRSGGLVWRDAISALYKASVAALENDWWLCDKVYCIRKVSAWLLMIGNYTSQTSQDDLEVTWFRCFSPILGPHQWEKIMLQNWQAFLYTYKDEVRKGMIVIVIVMILE